MVATIVSWILWVETRKRTNIVEQTQTVSNIGDNGARALSDALKANTILATLNLGGEQTQELTNLVD